MLKITVKPLTRLAQALGLIAIGTAAQAEDVKIAIANFGEHPQLTRAINGLRAALAEGGYVEGENTTYTISHTNFDATLLPQMLATLRSGRPDLLLTITTPVSQVALSTADASGPPIVFGAVTDPVAAGLTPSWESGGAGITGVADLQDVAGVLAFTKKLFPQARRLGLPYNPGEANDVALLEVVKTEGAKAGLEIVEVGIDTVNDIQQRIASLAGKADVLYVPTSNLIQPALPAVAAAARQIGVPIVNAAETGVREGLAAASFAVDYDQVGRAVGAVAIRVLEGEDPQSIAPFQPAYEDHAPLISRAAMAAAGAEIPDELADCGCIVE